MRRRHHDSLLVVFLAAWMSLFVLGCGSTETKKAEDPDKLEEQMKEYRKMSQKERNG